MGELTEVQAALRVRMSPRLLRWFTSYAPKVGSSCKLKSVKREGEYFYDQAELLAFDKFLREPWPPGPNGRPPIPAGVLHEIQAESYFQCAVCGHGNDGEAAHIDPVHKSHSNHPHNLLWTCPNHHTAYDHGHKVHATLDAAAVKSVKRLKIEAQERQWRTELRAVSAVLALIHDVEAIRAEMASAKSQAFKPGLLAAAKHAVDEIGKSAATSTTATAKALASAIAPLIQPSAPLTEQALDDVIAARDQFFRDRGQVPCPACNGNGTFGDYDVCPACGGDAYMSKDDAARIDAAEYRSVECPVCEGRGTRLGDECPACGGEGSLEKRHAAQLDLRDYGLAQCPLCKGARRYGDRDECPVCGGEGDIERRFAASVDLSQYRMVECKLCRGRGHAPGYDQCPACGGAGELEQRASDETDWSKWSQD